MKNKNLGIKLILVSLTLLLLFSMKDFSFADESKLHETITSDDLRVKELRVSTIDGSPSWDKDDKPGNDSGPSNGIVRSFDRISYDLLFVTESKSKSSYKKGRMYFEVELPLSSDEAVFDIAAMGLMDTAEGYKWTVEEKNGKQILRCYYLLDVRKADNGREIYPFPNVGTFPVYVKVKAMNNGDIVKPTFKASIEYIENGESKVEGAYNKKVEVDAGDVKVSAAPRYNIMLQKTPDLYAGAIKTFDFGTGDATALNKDAGNLYGRLQGYGITIELRNAARDNGLRGIELPKGDITLELDVSAEYLGLEETEKPGQNYGKVKEPLVWAYGAHMYQNSINGRSITPDSLSYLPGVGAIDGKETGELKPLPVKTGTSKLWNGGDWEVNQVGEKIYITVKDYVLNQDWFPSGAPGGADVKNYYDYDLGGVDNRGIFSSGAIYFVVPFGGEKIEDPQYYPQHFGEEGTVKTNLEVSDIKISSITGQTITTKEEIVKEDNRINTNVTLTNPGGFSKNINYRNPKSKSGIVGMDGVYYFGNYLNGTDSQLVGGEVGFATHVRNEPYGNKENALKGLNNLVKFDDKAFVIDGTGNFAVTNDAHTNNDLIETTHLYAAKPDGTGWKDDQEMNDTNEEDLVYYKTIEELEADGKICVGILDELRIPYDGDFYRTQYITIIGDLKLKSDIDLIGKTYMITSVQNVWRKADYKKTLEENGDKFPSRLDMQVGETIDNKTIDTHKKFYEKASYDDSGYVPATGGEPYWGDTLYVLPYKAEIKKIVEQKDINKQNKYYYDISQLQTIADYKISPKLNIPEELPNIVDTNFTTKVEIQDVLDKGLDYIVGSAIKGGDYEVSSNLNLPGIVTGGENFEPVVTTNDNGQQVLTWIIDNHKIMDEIDEIHYKVRIDPLSKEGKQYTNTASIGTTEDKRIKKSENGNQYISKIQISAPSLIVSNKEASKKEYQPGEVLEFNIEWMNNSKSYISDMIMMDTMPQNGDSKGSIYTGTYKVEEINLEFPDGKTNEDYRFYYTEDVAIEGKNSGDFEYKNFTGDNPLVEGITWKRLGIGSDGKVENIKDIETKAWVVLGDIDRGKAVKANIKITPEGNQKGDIYVNTASIYSLEKLAKANVGIFKDDARLTTEKIVKDEEGRVLKDGDKVKIGDMLTYEVKVKNPTVYDMFMKITDEAPVGTELVVIEDENGVKKPFGKLSNGGKLYLNKYEDEIKTDIMKIRGNEEIVLTFSVLVGIDEGRIKNIATVENYMPKEDNPEEAGNAVEPKKPESVEVVVEKAELIKARVVYMKSWDEDPDFESEYNNIDRTQNIRFEKATGTSSRAKGLVNGFGYSGLTEVYLGKELIYSGKDSIKSPVGDRILKDEDRLDEVNDSNILTIVHYYF